MKAKQWQEIRNVSKIELESKLRVDEDKLFRLKFKHFSTPIKNALEIRTLRRNIARYKTLLNENKENV